MPTAAPRLDLVVETSVPRGLRTRLKAVMGELLRSRGVQGQVCVVLADDGRLRQLKLEHWGEDASTDVLSFPQWEPGDPFVPAHLGDIVISVDTAKAQAAAHGHSLETEVIVLASHGLTHLLGFDHQRPEDWAPFHQAEQDARTALSRHVDTAVQRSGGHGD